MTNFSAKKLAWIAFLLTSVFYLFEFIASNSSGGPAGPKAARALSDKPLR